MQKHYRHSFYLHAITLDLGQGADFSPLTSFCQARQIPLHIEPTQIGEIVFKVRQETNPCSLCAKLRRGALHQVARRLNCNKVALGHHLDDAVETMLMNMLFAGKQGTFHPAPYLDQTGLTLIRPMVYLPQTVIAALVARQELPVVSNPCPASGQTKRQEMRQLVEQLAVRYPDIREKFLAAFQNLDYDNLWKQRRPSAAEKVIPKPIPAPAGPSTPPCEGSEPEYAADPASR